MIYQWCKQTWSPSLLWTIYRWIHDHDWSGNHTLSPYKNAKRSLFYQNSAGLFDRIWWCMLDELKVDVNHRARLIQIKKRLIPSIKAQQGAIMRYWINWLSLLSWFALRTSMMIRSICLVTISPNGFLCFKWLIDPVQPFKPVLRLGFKLLVKKRIRRSLGLRVPERLVEILK